MDIASVVSIVWIAGSVVACGLGCHRSRSLGRKLRALEEKLEAYQTPPLVYTAPIPSAPPMYDPRLLV